jgi:hypothetical protein
MKTTALIGLVTLTLIYASAETASSTATQTALEYEHNLKTTTSVEDIPIDMSKMKAAGKCGADQKAYKSTMTNTDKKASETTLEYEHQLKTAKSEEELPVDMSKMKAAGKCGADQKAYKPKEVKKDENRSETLLEYEHQLQSAQSEEEIPVDMSKMKAEGKCGSD